MSAEIAAVVMDRPLIEPELSTKIVTIVSLNLVSFSCLKLNGVRGSVIIFVNFEVSKIPSSLSYSQDLFCCANKSLCSLFASFAITFLLGSIN